MFKDQFGEYARRCLASKGEKGSTWVDEYPPKEFLCCDNHRETGSPTSMSFSSVYASRAYAVISMSAVRGR